MVIRQTQLYTLSQRGSSDFEVRVAAHLKRCFPHECTALGDEGVPDLVRYGVARSNSYGMTLERDVCKYIDLMVAFDRDFDRNPEHPWAARILADDSFPNPTARMEHLYGVAKSHRNPAVAATLL